MGSRVTQLLILDALYRTTRCGASLAVRCGGSRRTACSEYSDRRADLTLLIVGMLAVLDRKVLAPIGSDAGEVGLRGSAAARRLFWLRARTARRAAS